MAALICKSICYPCEYCGRCINRSCELCSKGCGECCDRCGKVCSKPCELIGAFLSKPFSGSVIMSFALNAAPFFLGLVYGLGGVFAGECSSLSLWLVVQMLVSAVHFAMSIYLFNVMQKPFNADDPTDRTLNARVQQMLCYDPWFAVYIILAIFQIVWLIMGSIWESGDVGEKKECDAYSPVVIVSLVLAWVYVCFGVLFFTCSWCCSATQDAAQEATNAARGDLQRAQNSVLGKIVFGVRTAPRTT